MDIVDLLLIIFFFFFSYRFLPFLRKNSSVFIEAEVSFCLSFVTIVQEIFFLREDYVKFGVYRYIGKIRSILEQWNGSLNGEGKLNIRW